MPFMEFLKLEGCGNDFVCLDVVSMAGDDTAALARSICDRHRGVGADGLMILAPDAEADGGMLFFNPDGSESATCGNALRCAALVLSTRLGRAHVSIRSGSEVRICEVLQRSGATAQVRVGMGRARLERSAIPMNGLPGSVVNESFPCAATETKLRVTALSLGNPHCVLFCDDVATAPVALLGPAIETDACFPQRTNVEFVQVLGRDRLRQRTWERGVGETPACGSGACAAAIAAVLNGHCVSPTAVELTGGELAIEWPDPQSEVLLTGPARQVFRGVW